MTRPSPGRPTRPTGNPIAGAAHPVPARAAGTAGRPQPPGLLAAGYLVFALAGVLAASYEVLLVPTRWGSTLVPVAPVLAVLGNIALPAIARGLTDTVRSALPPVLGWLVGFFVLSMARPEGDVLLPAGPTTWVVYALLAGGAVAGVGTLVAASRPGAWTGQSVRDRLARLRPARPGSDSGDAR